MSDSLATLTHKIDSLVFDCFQKSSDIILQGRRCSLEPESSSSSQVMSSDWKDNSEYCFQVLRDWKVNLNSPVVLDVSLLDPVTKEYYLMERWKIIYKRKDDTKDGRLSSVSRRIVTLMRTLYCFVRLLPGFQLLNMCPTIPILTFRLYDPEQPPSRNFVCESSYYDFPRIQTFRGTLYLGVRYMAANILQRILQIPQGLLTIPSDAVLMQSTSGRGDGSMRSTVPIPIPGMGIPLSSPPIYSSSEKVPSKLSFSVVGVAVPRTAVQGTSSDGIGFGNRHKDNFNTKQQEGLYPDQLGYRQESTATSTSQSRSLDSRPSGLQSQHHYLEGQPTTHPLLSREDKSSGDELPKYSLSTPPKHPQRLFHPGYNASNVAINCDLMPQEQVGRNNLVYGMGSYVSDSGTSPGGGTPFYISAAAILSPNSSGPSYREHGFGGQEVRARNSSSSIGFISSEADCDVTAGVGVSGASPPYFGISAQLMSTSPEVGYGAPYSLERSQGTMTLYQSPAYRKSYRDDEGRLADSREQQNNQLICNVRSNYQSTLSPEGLAINLSLRVVLPRSPFESVLSYSDSSCIPVNELALRSRPPSQSPTCVRGSYVDNVRDIVSPCHDRYLEEKECARTGELDDSKKHRNTFSIGVEEDHVDEGEDVDNDVVDEEEEEDMPFAWVDHLMTATQSFNVKTKIFGPAGDKEAERESFLAEGKVGSGPPSIQIGVGYSYNIPPALISFPDAPWYESGSAAVVTAISNQLSEYKEFRSTFSS